MVILLCRQHHHRQPEVFYGPDAFKETVEVYRLGDVTICMKLVRPQDVFFRAGRGQHNHRDGAEFRFPGKTNYSASKAGIIGFTVSLAAEVASRGVTVNAVSSGHD